MRKWHKVSKGNRPEPFQHQHQQFYVFRGPCNMASTWGTSRKWLLITVFLVWLWAQAGCCPLSKGVIMLLWTAWKSMCMGVALTHSHCHFIYTCMYYVIICFLSVLNPALDSNVINHSTCLMRRAALCIVEICMVYPMSPLQASVTYSCPNVLLCVGLQMFMCIFGEA